MQHSPFHHKHQALGARLTNFSGWEMPVDYGSILEEHRATREQAGLFDTSHMCRFLITGKEAVAATCSNDPDKLQPGKAQYSLLLDEQGRILDDVIVYQLDDEQFLLVANAGKTDIVRQAFAAAQQEDAVQDNSSELAMLALQGPRAWELAATCLPGLDSNLPYFGVQVLNTNGTELIVARTGYTGEKGLELMGPPALLLELWEQLLATGTRPVGLGARDTLRLEMGYPLWGNELAERRPFACGLGWAVRRSLQGFTGAEALAELDAEQRKTRLLGFMLEGRGIPRHGYPVLVDGRPGGVVTSGVFSPTLRQGIGLAFLDKPWNGTDTIEIQIRNTAQGAHIKQPPFVPNRTRD